MNLYAQVYTTVYAVIFSTAVSLAASKKAFTFSGFNLQGTCKFSLSIFFLVVIPVMVFALSLWKIHRFRDSFDVMKIAGIFFFSAVPFGWYQLWHFAALFVCGVEVRGVFIESPMTWLFLGPAC